MLAYSLVDPSSTYLANVITKSGRNEVQFHSLDGHPGDVVKRHELQTNDSILCACWINSYKNDTVKRKADRLISNGSAATPLLVVSLALAEVWVFSPASDHVIKKISSGSKIISVTGSLNGGHFWGLDESAQMVEFSAVEGKVLGKILATIKSTKKVPFTQILHILQPRKECLLLAAHDLYIIDGTKAKKNVLGTVKVGQDDISRITAVQNLVLVETKYGVWCVDLENPDQAPVSIGSALQASALRCLDAYSVAFTDSGAEFYLINSETLSLAAQQDLPVQRVACVKTASRSVRFENIFAGDKGVYAVWYHGLQPRFVKISDSVKFSGKYEIPIEEKENGHQNGHELSPHPEISFLAEESEINNLDPSELFEQLSAELLASAESAVLALCASNDNENSIKETIRQFSQSEKCSVLVDNLFGIISTRIAADPTHNLSLPIWLKWVLLIHGGYISKQAEMASRLKTLQLSLDQGLALIPKLLGLQGRLQLLKAQAEYRNKISVEGSNDADQEEREFEAVNDTLNNTTAMEDLVVYNETFNPEVEATLEFEDGEAAGEEES